MHAADCRDERAMESEECPGSRSLRRLERRAHLFEPLTEQLFRQVGLAQGMRVLVVGCRTGDVALHAARVVGPTGTVVCIDESEIAIHAARKQTRPLGSAKVRFVQCPLDRYSSAAFDVVVCRFGLMNQPDPAVTIWRLATFVRNGGLLAIQEFDFSQPAFVFPQFGLVRDAARWIAGALDQLGYQTGIGMRLHHAFQSSGLSRPSMMVGAGVESAGLHAVSELLGEMVRDLLLPICESGVATSAEIAIESLASRIRLTALETDAVFVSPLVVSAWTRVHRRPTGQLASPLGE